MRGNEAGILCDEFSFGGVTSQIEIQCQVNEAESTNLDSTAAEFEPLLATWRITQAGWFSGADAGGFETELRARLAQNGVLVTALLGKSTVKCSTFTIPNSTNVELAIAAPMNNLMTLAGNWGSTQAIRKGYRILGTTVDATGEQTAQDYGAGTTIGGYAFLHVTAITGAATNASIKIQSSPDNSTWSDEATFTISAVGGYTAALSGTVGRYLRVNVVDLGGADDIALTAIVSLN
jgi:hypothetical protein